MAAFEGRALPHHAGTAVALDVAGPGGGGVAESEAVGFEDVDDVGPLAGNDVGGGRGGGERDLCAGLEREGDVPWLVGVTDTHGAGDGAELARELIAVEEDGRSVAGGGESEGEFGVGERVCAELGGFGIGIVVEGDELGGVAVDDLKELAQQLGVAGNAGLVVLEHVELDEQAGAVFEDRIAGGKARRVGVEAEALGGVGVVVEVDESGKGEMAGCVEVVDDLWRDDVVKPMGGGGGDVGRVVGVEGDVVLVVHAVGDVVVDEEVGEPAVEDGEEGAGFRGVGLHVVAIEVDVGAVAAPAGHFWAVLVDAVIG